MCPACKVVRPAGTRPISRLDACGRRPFAGAVAAETLRSRREVGEAADTAPVATLGILRSPHGGSTVERTGRQWCGGSGEQRLEKARKEVGSERRRLLLLRLLLAFTVVVGGHATHHFHDGSDAAGETNLLNNVRRHIPVFECFVLARLMV